MTKSKNMSRVMSLLLALVMAVGLFATSAITAFAAGPYTIDTEADGSLTIYKLETDSGITQLEYDALEATEQAKYLKADDGKWYIFFNDAEYTVYKIGTIEQDTSGTGGALTDNVKFVPISGLKYKNGTDITTFSSTTVPDSIDISTATQVGSSQATSNNGSTTFNFTSSGDVYLVVETRTPAGVTTAKNFIVTVPMTNATGDAWEYDVVAYPKNTKIDAEISKTIVDGAVADGTIPNTFSADRDGVITYSAEVLLPSDFTTASYTKFNIVDTPDGNLQITAGTVNVEVVTDDTTTPVTTQNITSNCVIDLTSNKLTISLIKINDNGTPADDTDDAYEIVNALLTNSAKVIITYDVKVATDAPINTPMKNDIKIEYLTKNGPTNPPPVDPTDPDPTVYTYAYSLKKIGEGTGDTAYLNGAEFVIRKDISETGTPSYVYLAKDAGGKYIWVIAAADGSVPADVAGTHTIVRATSGTTPNVTVDGLVVFEGLAKGDYEIVETKAPSNAATGKQYGLLKDPISVTINAGTTSTYMGTAAGDPLVYPYNGFTITVKNVFNAANLPTTGGAGIYIFLIIGAVLIAAAAVLFIKTRKNNVA